LIEHPVIAAIALVMICEGIMPFIAPKMEKHIVTTGANGSQLS